jgi:riboflavin kinase / FMN adenylyltransferase
VEIIRGLQNLQPRHQECVVTIGNFDGLHLGHQMLLKKLIAVGQERQLPTLAIIFEPQPNEFFFQDAITPRLMRFREKVAGLRAQGVARVLCLKFDQKLAGQTAELFVREVLVTKLAAKYVLVGDDFHFGYKRLGDYKLLRALGRKYHFQTEAMHTYKLLGERVSSSRIRKLLEQGRLEIAGQLLGRPFSMQGVVAHGDKRGRLLGFPTANIALHRSRTPIKGIFAVLVLGISPSPLAGVASIGTRPTVVSDQRTLLEVYLLNFDENIYGKRVEVQFLQKFREEIKFASLEDLKRQIAQDVVQAEEFHRKRSLQLAKLIH